MVVVVVVVARTEKGQEKLGEWEGTGEWHSRYILTGASVLSTRLSIFVSSACNRFDRRCFSLDFAGFYFYIWTLQELGVSFGNRNLEKENKRSCINGEGSSFFN